MFGAKQYNLDAKLRLTLPADFRRELEDKVRLIPFDGCVYGFAPEKYEEWVSSFFEGGKPNPQSRREVAIERGIHGSTVSVDVDSAGRIALGKLDSKKRESLGIAGEVVVVGNGDHFEIWNSQKWDEVQTSFEDDFESLIYDA